MDHGVPISDRPESFSSNLHRPTAFAIGMKIDGMTRDQIVDNMILVVSTVDPSTEVDTSVNPNSQPFISKLLIKWDN